MFETTFMLGQAPAPAGGGLGGTLMMVGMMFLVFYFLVWRPEAKKNNEHASFLKALKVGDEVVTTGGLVGKITLVEDEIITLELNKNSKVRVIKRQIQGTPKTVIAQLQGPVAAAAAKKDEDEKKDKKKEEEEAEGAW